MTFIVIESLPNGLKGVDIVLRSVCLEGVNVKVDSAGNSSSHFSESLSRLFVNNLLFACPRGEESHA